MVENLAFEERLDIRDMDCPQPIMHTKAILGHMESGDHLEITANNREFISEIHMMSAHKGHTILEEDIKGNVLSFIVQKK